MRTLGIPITIFVLLLATGTIASAHCQVPCGIYDDPARLAELSEHITTIEKSMREIVAIGGSDSPNWNQAVRWVNNKEHHADEFMEIVTAYFMVQRIKPVDSGDSGAEKYSTELELLHRMLVRAMKAKQTTDLSHVEALRGLLDQFSRSYLAESGS